LAPDFVSPGGWQAPPMAARHSHLVNREQRARVADLVRVIAAAAAVAPGQRSVVGARHLPSRDLAFLQVTKINLSSFRLIFL